MEVALVDIGMIFFVGLVLGIIIGAALAHSHVTKKHLEDKLREKK